MQAYRDRDIFRWFRYAPENRRGYSTAFPPFSAPCWMSSRMLFHKGMTLPNFPSCAFSRPMILFPGPCPHPAALPILHDIPPPPLPSRAPLWSPRPNISPRSAAG
jgi:hypothetical protein